MKIKTIALRMMVFTIALAMALPPSAFSAESGAAPAFKQEELDQLLAPIALYPDELLSQVLMASTYPLEVVQAARWAENNRDLQGDALTEALDKENWDPSVKSLVNFPDVLTMMSKELDWTQKLGDAFLAQQKGVLDTVQKLRDKAYAEGNLQTTNEQKVIVEKETQTIIIEPADPKVVYVPVYNPTVVYGRWWYPAYPPHVYYPPGYVIGRAIFSFGAGVAVGAAWGWAWGGCNWRRRSVDIDVNRNINLNRNINRDRYRREMAKRGQIDRSGKGRWQHNPKHRKGAPYRNEAMARKFNKGLSPQAVKSREAFRGRAQQDRRKLQRTAARTPTGKAGRTPARRPQQGAQKMQRPTAKKAPTRQVQRQPSRTQRSYSKGRARQGGTAFKGVSQGRSARKYSQRGSRSRQSMSSRKRGSGSRGGGNARRGGGGGRRGGGRR